MNFVRFAFATKEFAKIEFHCCVSQTGQYGSPNGMLPEPFSQPIHLHFSSGKTRNQSGLKLVKPRDDFRIAIVVEPSDSEFDITAALSPGVSRRLKNPDRIRAAVAEANDQFKNALRYRTAPCLLTIFHDGLDVPDDAIIKSALYGNLKFVFPVADGVVRLLRDN